MSTRIARGVDRPFAGWRLMEWFQAGNDCWMEIPSSGPQWAPTTCLARRLHCNRGDVHRWCKSMISVDVADRLATRLNVHASAIWPSWWDEAALYGFDLDDPLLELADRIRLDENERARLRDVARRVRSDA